MENNIVYNGRGSCDFKGARMNSVEEKSDGRNVKMESHIENNVLQKETLMSGKRRKEDDRDECSEKEAEGK